MKISELEYYLEDFLAYCQNKNLSRKTIGSYEQSLKLFIAYLKDKHDVEKVSEVRTGHIRQYIAYVQERGKYTVVSRESSKQVNFPEKRTDYKKRFRQLQ
ncbi:site-specific integrase [Paenibacillus sp. FSL L8-0436]|uniref:site-specific integrase n=1 Tax=Paenibacillus sp. FSL L8-0436 TaxID=2954686 RepID=UPI003159798F